MFFDLFFASTSLQVCLKYMKKLNIFFEVDIYNNELLIHPHQTSTQCGIDTNRENTTVFLTSLNARCLRLPAFKTKKLKCLLRLPAFETKKLELLK